MQEEGADLLGRRCNKGEYLAPERTGEGRRAGRGGGANGSRGVRGSSQRAGTKGFLGVPQGGAGARGRAQDTESFFLFNIKLFLLPYFIFSLKYSIICYRCII